MTVYPKTVLRRDEFGELLSQYIQKSRGIEIDHEFNFHITEEDGTNTTFSTDDIFGLMCAVGAVIRRFEPAIVKQYGNVDDYGLDIYDEKGTVFMQIDKEVESGVVTDVRFNKDIFKEFGYIPVALEFARNGILNLTNKEKEGE